MPMISITNCLYANATKTIAGIAEKMGSTVVTDADILEKTHQTYKMDMSTLRKVVESEQIEFNEFTHVKEKCTALLMKTISNYALQKSCIFHGILGHLIPREISHVMRVLVIADKKSRIENGMANPGLTKEKVLKNMEIADRHAILWTTDLFGKTAWDESLYDMLIPTDKLGVNESVSLVSGLADKHFEQGEPVENEIANFNLTADVAVSLSEIGQGLLVTVQDGTVVVTIDNKVQMLSKLKQKIVHTVQEIPGVKSVTTKIGQNYYKGNIVYNYDIE